MALILSVDTATENATICLGNENEIIAFEKNDEQMNHAAFVQPAIDRIMKNQQIHLQQLDAVAVSAGPGSYTGLRVGLASAKGLCFALNKPLILLNTLQVIAAQAVHECKNENAFYCPMIDARRMEVFTALYDASLKELSAPKPIVITDENFIKSFDAYDNDITFFGSGMPKWQGLATENNFLFQELSYMPPHGLNLLAQQFYAKKHFADLAYSEPFYFKEFYTTAKING